MKIVIEKNKDNFLKVTPSQDITFGQTIELYINAIRASLERVVEEVLTQEDNTYTEEQLKAQVHDFVVVNISTMLNEFDPASKEYTHLEE